MKKRLFSLIVTTLAAAQLIAVPQAVVFDFGGVMTGEPNREVVVNFIRATFHFSESEYEKVNQEKRKAVKGGVSDEQFWIAYAKEKGIKLPPDFSENFQSALKEAIGINHEMYHLVEQLKMQQIPVAMLSNIDSRLAGMVKSFGLYEPFYPCLLSCEIGVEKPDLKAFEILLERLGLPASEVVYIDDNSENIEAARKTGLDAILFESTGQIRSQLTSRGALE